MRCLMLFQGLVYEIMYCCSRVWLMRCVMLFQGLVYEMCNAVPGFG